MDIISRKTFGSGLEAVLEAANVNIENLKAHPAKKQELKQVMVHHIIPGRFQPRKDFDQDALQELSNSIAEQGVLQPIVVRRSSANEYEIIAGERRWRAAQMAGLQQVPVIICSNISDESALVFGIIENIQRENLNPIEEAEAYSRLKDGFSMTHSEIAEMVGKSRVSITNTMRLLLLDESVRKFLVEGKLDTGHARAILNLEPEQQILLAQKIIEVKLTVREAEKLASDLKLRKIEILKTINLYKEKNDLWSTILSEKLSSKVRVNLKEKGSGKISIYVDSPQEIEWIINHIRVN